jgi:16S rRNA (guanine527-N7)-methyltransferase
MSPAQQLAAGIDRLGLSISPDAQARLLAYLDLIVKWNRVHNLTAIRDVKSMVSAHLLDSLAVAPHLVAETILDVGSGGGLPGIPLAMIWPQAKVTLIDSNQKKTTFLQQAKIELAIENLTVVCARVEAWKTDARFDLVISRAFSDLAEFVKVAHGFCKQAGTLAAMKGVQPDDEIKRLPAGCKLREVIALNVPDLNAERHLVLIDP